MCLPEVPTGLLLSPPEPQAVSMLCRLDNKEKCGNKFDEFLERCFYQPGQYDSEVSTLSLLAGLQRLLL